MHTLRSSVLDNSFFSSSGGFGSNDADFSDDEDSGFSIRARFEKNRDSVIFLIDAGENMMKPGADGKSALGIVIDLLKTVVQGRLIQGGKDELGVCFYNTDKSKNSNGFPGIYNAIDLDEPDAKVVQELEKLEDKKKFDADIGGGEECEFHQALWTCSAIFSNKKNAKKSHQRIMLFTGNDRPNAKLGSAKYEELKRRAVQKAKDLDDLDIALILNSINVDGTKFKVQHFFADMIYIDDEDGIDKFEEQVAQNFEDLKAKCYKRIFQKRALASCPMTIGDDIKIGLKLYSVLRPATKRTPVQLDSRNNQRLTCVTKWVCASTGSALEEYQIRTYFPYGCEKVYFTKAEINQIKDFGPPGIKLMGFKPSHSLKWENNLKPALFLRPDEGQVKGSTTAFIALLEEMQRLRKIAIAQVIYRKCSAPRFAALLPTKFKEGDQWEDKTGFYLIFLPYADDTREPQIPAMPVADDTKLPGLIANTRTLVRDLLKDDIDPDSYSNPLLQKHYANLEAMALEKEDPGEVEDELIPDEKLLQNVEDTIDTIQEIVESVEEPELRGKKRKGGGGGKSRAKKPKVEVEVDEFKKLAASDHLGKLKVARLKDYCRAFGLPLGGRKADLVDRVKDHLDKNP